MKEAGSSGGGGGRPHAESGQEKLPLLKYITARDLYSSPLFSIEKLRVVKIVYCAPLGSLI